MHELGHLLPVWSVIPFAGMLLSIALFPLFKPHWWEENIGKVSIFWGIIFVLPFLAAFGSRLAFYKVLHIYLLDYLPFIILLLALFTISGGIIVRGTLRGTPLVNGGILLIGTLLASWIGTTGASMLLIRPLLRAIKDRKWRVHTVVFFIFLVSNIGGSLTPLGDPPLFLGFLHGVPFFWTMHLLPLMSFNVLVLLVLYLIIDYVLFKKEKSQTSKTLPLETDNSTSKSGADSVPLRVEGLQNLIFLAGVLVAVILSGTFSHAPCFTHPLTGEARGIYLMQAEGHALVWPYLNILRDASMLLMAGLSLKFTARTLRKDNFFTWGPIKEVAKIFAGIFVTMIPALEILQTRGAELGLSAPSHFFWATGLLSSFLDNAPTYLTFLSLAGGIGGTSGIVTDLGTVAPEILLAISCGAVFMGANTYIGNAPNFMVRSIAEENQVKMPSFFGYMGWAILILIPLFFLNAWLFFR